MLVIKCEVVDNNWNWQSDDKNPGDGTHRSDDVAVKVCVSEIEYENIREKARESEREGEGE